MVNWGFRALQDTREDDLNWPETEVAQKLCVFWINGMDNSPRLIHELEWARYQRDLQSSTHLADFKEEFGIQLPKAEAHYEGDVIPAFSNIKGALEFIVRASLYKRQFMIVDEDTPDMPAVAPANPFSHDYPPKEWQKVREEIDKELTKLGYRPSL